MKLKWEQLEQSPIDETETFRTKVPGGWLVKETIINSEGCGTGIAFYPDPNHIWDGGSLP